MLRVIALLLVVLVGCSSAGGASPDSGGGAGEGQAGEGAGGEGQGGEGGAAGGGGGVNIGGQTGAPTEAEVFGHSQGTLYKLNPKTKQVTTVGAFTCLGQGFGSSMWDIAIDKDGAMIGTTDGGLVTIDRATAKCTGIKGGSYPNSLAFIPAGQLDANDEALVGFNQATYVRIDKATGQVTTLGSLNPNPTGKDWESSGDVVSIIGDKTYLTVHGTGFGSFGPDSIIEVDPKTGKALKVIGGTGYEKLWGLGYWGGVAYGFSDGGQLIEIDLSNGKSTLVPGLPSGLSFWGAGVTTAAPTSPIN